MLPSNTALQDWRKASPVANLHLLAQPTLPPSGTTHRPKFIHNKLLGDLFMTKKAIPLAMAFLLSLAAGISAPPPTMTVFKTKTCGCCAKWVEHMRASGFQVTVNEVPSTGVYRQKYGVPEKLQSCHTAVVDGYTVEGHVPAADVLRLLKEKPKAKGLAVPGMPVGSPGMESTYQDAYSVLKFDENGMLSVYQNYPAKGK